MFGAMWPITSFKLANGNSQCYPFVMMAITTLHINGKNFVFSFQKRDFKVALVSIDK